MLDTVLIVALFCAAIVMIQVLDRHNHLQNHADELLRSYARAAGYHDAIRDVVNDVQPNIPMNKVIAKYDHIYRKK